MKKLLAMILVLTIILSCPAAMASDTGIMIIGGSESAASDAVDLDDMKVNQTVDIDEFGEVTIVKAEWVNEFYTSDGWMRSGDEAEYLFIEVRILNTQKKAQNYHPMFGDIICDYGDGFQFKGWYRQKNSDVDDGSSDVRWYKDAQENYEIEPLYAGRYLVCVTLPNQVRTTEDPLSVTFTIGGNEFTYHHRK